MSKSGASRGSGAMRSPGQALAAVLALAVVWVLAPADAAGEAALGRDALIAGLVPITGDPLGRRSVELRIRFHLNSAELTDASAAQLHELGAALLSERLRGAPVGIYGHTDASGPADYNLALSERRAQAVARFLREQAGVAAERIREIRGYGEEKLREDLPPEAPAQRRVRIVAFHDAATGEFEMPTKTAPLGGDRTPTDETRGVDSPVVAFPGGDGAGVDNEKKKNRPDREAGPKAGGYIPIR